MAKFRARFDEGLDPFTKAAGVVLLRYVARGRKEFKEMMTLVRSASSYFEHMLHGILNGPTTAAYDELIELGVVKKKYIPYAAYMAVISTYPLLAYSATKAQILSTILAKMALILSIKSLDNINDTYHSREEAALSLERQVNAIVGGELNVVNSGHIVKKAENSCMMMALLVHHWLTKKVTKANITRDLFFNDLRLYIDGQRHTFRQQCEKGRQYLNIRDYLKNINEKGVGRIWVGLDLCMLEHTSLKTIKDYVGINLVRKAFDYIFKSSNYYDDVADLESDLKAGIWNSVVFLGRDLGILKNPEEALKNKTVKYHTVRLGDLHYLTGLQFLKQACKHLNIRSSSLIASMNVFRFFTIRKWFYKSRNPFNLIDFLAARASSEISKYAEMI